MTVWNENGEMKMTKNIAKINSKTAKCSVKMFLKEDDEIVGISSVEDEDGGKKNDFWQSLLNDEYMNESEHATTLKKT